MSPRTDNPTDAGDGRQVPIPRRAALGRLFGLGIGAAAVVVLPAPAQAGALTPSMPDWLAEASPSLLVSLERIVKALPAGQVNSRKEGTTDNLHLTGDGLADWLAMAVEHSADPDYYTVVISGKYRSPDGDALAATPKPPARPRFTPVDDRRVAVIKFSRLDRCARRRAQRWIAQQPVGPRHPLIRLRLGRRHWPEQADVDFLDVARPQRSFEKDSASVWAQTVFKDFRVAVGRTRGADYPSVGAYMVQCSHSGSFRDGAATDLHLDAGGRVIA